MLTLCYLLIALGGGKTLPLLIQTSQATQKQAFLNVEYIVEDQEGRWRLWVSDLIAWSQYSESPWHISFGPLRAPYLVMKNSKGLTME